jgi:hypothetical protein
MARAVPIAVLGLAGCAQLFGLDETTAPGDAAPPSASLQIDRISIGTTLERAPLDLTGQVATYLIADAAEPSGLRRVQATLTDSHDGWTADIPEGSAAAVEFSVPEDEPYRRLVAFPSHTIATLFGAYEHPSPEPAPMGGTLTATLALPSGYATGEYFRLEAIGPWARHQLAAAELPAVDTGATSIGPVTIPYDTTGFSSLVGARPLPKLTAQDRIVALRYVGNDLTAAAIVSPFDQTGGDDPFTATLAPVAHAPLDVTIDPMATATRLSGTSPPVTSLSMSWSVVAAPAWQLANNHGPVLQAAGVADTDPGAITAAFGNPFTDLGWASLFTWAANRSRTYTEPSLGLAVTLYAGLNHLDDVAPGLVLDQPAGLPVLVSIDKQPLNMDGLTITLDPAKSVELSLVADRPTNLFYQWNVYELVPNAAMPPTALDRKVVYAALGTETTITIPNDVFVAGRIYTIRAHCVQGGYPGFSTGDLQERDVPYAVGYLDSGVFTVAAP